MKGSLDLRHLHIYKIKTSKMESFKVPNNNKMNKDYKKIRVKKIKFNQNVIKIRTWVKTGKMPLFIGSE